MNVNFVRVICIAACLAIGSGLSASPRATVDELARVIADEGLAGAVWATVASDGGVETGATGLKDVRSGAALGPDDQVHVGSVAKTLLATGILRLVTEGRLELDAPVEDVLPDVRFVNPWGATDPVRVRHLLDHTSGLDDLHLWQFFSAKPAADTPLTAAFAGDPGLLRVRARPGTRFSYSNMGYALAGRVIESITGARYEQYLDAHLLRPLSMHDSTFAFVTQEGPSAQPRLAMGHFEDGTPHAAVPVYLRPGGQFTTTAKDMGRFAQFLMSDGQVRGARFIAPELLRAMGRSAGTEAALAGLQVGYGLGLATRDRNGVVGQCHEGSVVGFRAMLCLFPLQQRAFFVAINTDSETADHGRVYATLIRMLQLPPLIPPPELPRLTVTKEWNGFYVPAPNRFDSFAWLDVVFGFVHVSKRGDALRLRTLQSPKKELRPVASSLFRGPDRAIASHAFLTADDGSSVMTTGMQSFERVSPAYLGLWWTSLVAGSAALLYLLFSGLGRLLAGRLRVSHPVFVPLVAILSLGVPVPLFLGQSFIQLGDLTPASASLAVVTAALPMAMLIGVYAHLRSRHEGRMATLEFIAMLAVLQLAAVLAAWGLLPMRLWA